MVETDIKSDWKLKDIRFSFMEYGENKGKYEGKITFENGDQESFSFKLKPEMCNQYISLMSNDIKQSANELGEKLIKSLGI